MPHFTRLILIALPLIAPLPGAAAPAQDLVLDTAGYYRAPGVNVLVFSNWYNDLFADSKISGVEVIQQGERTVTNGDVRLSATPGQWDPIGRLVDRTVDPVHGVITATLEYPGFGFRYVVRSRASADAVTVTVDLDRPLPPALVGKAGFNLEFLPAAYFHKSYMADGKSGTFPIYPASGMVLTPERNPASGRSEGPGAEPLAISTGKRFDFAPEDPARHITVTATDGQIALFDGRNQAQNGWFVLRGLLPAGKTGHVLEWTVRANSVPGWLRPPVIAHSQLGYAPGSPKIATIELDADDHRVAEPKLLKVEQDGRTVPVPAGSSAPWGAYLRYRYLRFDFSSVRTPGTYLIEYGATRTAPFRIAGDIYDDAWHPTLDVYFPVAMDHMRVNEAYRVWHGDPHRDDALQAMPGHEHFDLYAQGPGTDDRYRGGEHIPGLNVGGWFDAGDFDIRTQTQYFVIRSMVMSWEQFAPARDTTSVDETLRRVEIHVPDGMPDLIEQIRHGTIQLVAQFDAVGHAINGIVEPDIGEYTHLGDAASKTDGLVYDPRLAFGEEKGGRSGTPDDRIAFTTRSSALNFGSIAALAAASRALRGHDDALADKAVGIARRVWTEEHSHAPDLYSHGNTTGGPLLDEEFAAAVELLRTTRDPVYASRVSALWPQVAAAFYANVETAVAAIPFMPASYRMAMEPAVRAFAARADAAAKVNPFGVPITTGGWAGNGSVLRYGLDAYALHTAFPAIVDGGAVLRAVDYLTGHHPASDVSFVSAVGTVSKEIAYGNNRADFSFIAGGVVPGVLIIKPDFPENHEDWPFFWGENEYVVSEGAAWIQLANAARALVAERAAHD
jgi:endoglucanase